MDKKKTKPSQILTKAKTIEAKIRPIVPYLSFVVNTLVNLFK